MKILIITGSGLRHTFFRKAIALDPSITVLKAYCEETTKNLQSTINYNNQDSDIQVTHLAQREQSEKDFFLPFISLTPNLSSSMYIPFGEVNKQNIYNEMIQLNPDLIVAYGCSLIKKRLIKAFEGKFLNVHLGLSPYYRGTATNFWPLVNNEPEYVGATFMYIDEGIDTGEIIHQIRPTIIPGDTPHQIGNRLISEMVLCYIKIINNIKKLKRFPYPNGNIKSKLYFRKQFSPESVHQLYNNFKHGMIDDYLINKQQRDKNVPIFKQAFMD